MDMNSIGQDINAKFIQAVTTGTPDTLGKVAAEFTQFIQDRMPFRSLEAQILPPKPVNPQQCRKYQNFDVLVTDVEVKPTGGVAQAGGATFLGPMGQPEATLYQGDQLPVALRTIASPIFQKPITEIQTYRNYSIVDVVKDIIIESMSLTRDREFLLLCEAAVQFIQLEANAGVGLNNTGLTGGAPPTELSIFKGTTARTAGTGDTFDVWPVEHPDITRLRQTFPGRSGRGLKATRLAMSDYDYIGLTDLATEAMFSSSESKDQLVKGFTDNSLQGLQIKTTNATQLLRPGNVYAFADSEYFGVSLMLQKPTIEMEKRWRWMFIGGYLERGLCIVNIAGLAKLETYGGSATPGYTDAGYADVIPVGIPDLLPKNTRTRETPPGYFPQVQY